MLNCWLTGLDKALTSWVRMLILPIRENVPDQRVQTMLRLNANHRAHGRLNASAQHHLRVTASDPVWGLMTVAMESNALHRYVGDSCVTWHTTPIPGTMRWRKHFKQSDCIASLCALLYHLIKKYCVMEPPESWSCTTKPRPTYSTTCTLREAVTHLPELW